MNTTMTCRCVVIGGWLWACQGALAQSIGVVNPAPGYQYSSASYAAPGGAVVGISLNPGVYAPAPTRWASIGAGAELLGVSAVGGGGEPYRCSDDGQVVVGRWLPDVNTSTPAMWGPTGAYTALPGPGTVSEANGVSADGTYVTGWSATSQGRWLLRWNNGVLTQQFGPSFVSGPCSPAGNTAIGVVYLGGSAAALGRWSSAGGPNGSVQTLTQFPAMWTNIRNPTAMTPTADAAAGIAYTTSNVYQGWVWRSGQFTDMGLPASAETMNVTGIRADGGLVTGNAYIPIQPNVFATRAEFWTPQTGWRLMADWLAAQSIAFPGWTFESVNSISPDGLTLAGQGLSPLGQVRGYVITIPTPGGAAAVLALGLAGVRTRRRS